MSEQLILQFITGVLVSILTKTQDNLLNKFSDQLANKIQDKTGKLVTLVKSTFRDDKEKKQFKEFESKPTENREMIEKILMEKLRDDSDFRKSLFTLIEEFQKIPDVEIYMKNINSGLVKGAYIGKISNRTLKHSMENITAKNVEGPTIEEIK